MHERPALAWTVEALAREVGMSRSVFAERFASFVAAPPMEYLARWRLQRAATLLSTRAISIPETAAEVGYESEAAFNRAFKRYDGQPPEMWRKNREASSCDVTVAAFCSMPFNTCATAANGHGGNRLSAVPIVGPGPVRIRASRRGLRQHRQGSR